MPYTWTFNTLFASEFKNFSKELQEKILDFVETYEKYGLGEFTNYEGKISPSWSGDNTPQANYDFAHRYDLWHYHVGEPEYESMHPKYKTSEYVLHLQWPDWQNQGTHINIVDCYSHYDSDGNFYLPPQAYLDLDN